MIQVNQTVRTRVSQFLAEVARDCDKDAGKIGADADCARWYFLRVSEHFDIPVCRLELFAEGAISALTDEQVATLAAVVQS